MQPVETFVCNIAKKKKRQETDKIHPKMCHFFQLSEAENTNFEFMATNHYV